MRRRALLGLLGASGATIAGCGGLGDDDPARGGRGTPTGTARVRTSTGTLHTDPTWTVDETTTGPDTTPPEDDSPGDGSTDDGPADDRSRPPITATLETGDRTVALPPYLAVRPDGLDVGIGLVATATADHPAGVRLTFRNRSPERRTLRRAMVPLLSDEGLWRRHASPASRLFLVPANEHRLASRVPTVVRGEAGFWRLDGETAGLVDRFELAGDETATVDFFLVAGPTSPRLPPGRYGPPTEQRIAVWRTSAPGPTAESRFAGLDVPSLDPERPTDWFHEAGPRTPTFVRPSVERTDLPARVRLTFVNHTAERAECGSWALYKLHDGRWHHVAPHVVPMVCRLVYPGGVDAWVLHASTGESRTIGDAAGDAGARVQSLGHLGGGIYAFEAAYSTPSAAAATHAALLELQGPAVAVTPRDPVTSERDGGTVTVTTPRWQDGERPPDATLTLRRLPDPEARPDDQETILAEQVLHPPLVPLRDALPFVAGTRPGDDPPAGVETVVLRTDEYAVDDVVGHDGPTREFAFRGQAYEATAERLGE